MPKPDFLICGAARSGTTSLYTYICQHPLVTAASRKEIHFFDLFYEKGIQWYKTQFGTVKEGCLVGEASPSYMCLPGIAEKIASALPDVKLIFILRNPVDRAYSNYHLLLSRNHESLPFSGALAEEDRRIGPALVQATKTRKYPEPLIWFSYFYRGLYASLLKPYFFLFPKDQIHVIKSEDFFDDVNTEINKVYEFLGLPRRTLTNIKTHKVGPDTYPPMDAQVKQTLQQLYKPHNQELSAMLGWQHSWE